MENIKELQEKLQELPREKNEDSKDKYLQTFEEQEALISKLKDKIRKLEDRNSAMRESYQRLSETNVEYQHLFRKWKNRAEVLKKFVDIDKLTDYAIDCKGGHIVGDINLVELIENIKKSVRQSKSFKRKCDISQLVYELESAVKDTKDYIE